LTPYWRLTSPHDHPLAAAPIHTYPMTLKPMERALLICALPVTAPNPATSDVDDISEKRRVAGQAAARWPPTTVHATRSRLLIIPIGSRGPAGPQPTCSRRFALRFVQMLRWDGWAPRQWRGSRDGKPPLRHPLPAGPVTTMYLAKLNQLQWSPVGHHPAPYQKARSKVPSALERPKRSLGSYAAPSAPK